MAKKKSKKAARKPARKTAARAKAGRTAGAKKKVAPVPKGYHTVTPHLVLDDANGALGWYAKAFGAKETLRMPGPGGKLLHAEMKIGDSFVMLSDDFPEADARAPRSIGGASGGVMLYVKDCDKLYEQAVKAGATAKQPPVDMFWGDRYSKVIDPYGHVWALATHKEDVTPREMAKRMRDMGGQGG